MDSTLVCLTNDEVLADQPLVKKSLPEMEAYLNASPRNALVIGGAKKVYVLRGASEQPNNFYYGLWPAEDPNDAEGGDLTASQAIAEALKWSTSDFDAKLDSALDEI